MKINLAKKVKHITTEYKLGDFFRNLIAVILGIVITFMGNDMITEHNTQKEVKKALLLVKSELLLNREQINGMGEQVTLEQRGAHYLLNHKGRMKEASQDSLNQYVLLPLQLYSFSIMNDAMEMLKSSALIQKIDDKELAMQIIKTYGGIKTAQECFLFFNATKKEFQDTFAAVPEIKRYLTESKVIDWDFLFKHLEAVSLINQIPQIQSPDIYYANIKLIDETIAAIDNVCN
ncbi:hypothetical protein [Bacteroides sp.]